MASEQEVVVTEVLVDSEGEEDTYHSYKSISSIAMLANVMAWVLLVLSIIGMIVLGIVIWEARTTITGTNGIFSVVSAIVPFFPGFFFFVVLKAISEGLYVLIDIEANTRRAGSARLP